MAQSHEHVGGDLHLCIPTSDPLIPVRLTDSVRAGSYYDSLVRPRTFGNEGDVGSCIRRSPGGGMSAKHARNAAQRCVEFSDRWLSDHVGRVDVRLKPDVAIFPSTYMARGARPIVPVENRGRYCETWRHWLIEPPSRVPTLLHNGNSKRGRLSSAVQLRRADGRAQRLNTIWQATP